MTYRDWMKQNLPEKVNDQCNGGVFGCPGDYIKDAPICDEECEEYYGCFRCWDQKLKHDSSTTTRAGRLMNEQNKMKPEPNKPVEEISKDNITSITFRVDYDSKEKLVAILLQNGYDINISPVRDNYKQWRYVDIEIRSTEYTKEKFKFNTNNNSNEPLLP